MDHIVFQQNSTTRMTRTNQFDALNRLTSVSSASSVVSYAYTYNSALPREIAMRPGSLRQCFTQSRSKDLCRLLVLSHGASQRTRVDLADGSYWLYAYDALGQVVSGKRYWSDGTLVAGQQFEYGFDDIGNRKNTRSGGDQNGLDLRSSIYSANALNQYTNRTVPGFLNILGQARTNATVTLWSAESLSAVTPTYRKGEYFRGELPLNNSSGAVWLTITNLAVLNNGTNADIISTNIGRAFVPRTPEAFAYDADGNLTNDARWTYTWDAENRLTSFTRPGTVPDAAKVKVDCQYDSRGRRTQKIVSSWKGSAYVTQSTNRFLYDGWNLVGTFDAQSSLLQSFTWGTDLSGTAQGAGGVGGLKSMTVHSGSLAGTYSYCYDANGNVAALVAAADGSVAAQYEYGPFGEVIRATGPLAQANPFLFSTKFCDLETGLYYYGFRYYDPILGRWLNRDPIQELGGRNLYGFVKNNAINKLDRLGLTLVAEIPAEITLEIEAGISLAQIAADYGLTLAQVTQMAAALAAAKAIDQIVKNLQNTAKGKDPCEKAKDAVRAARKSLDSFQKLIDKHQGWINDPTSYKGGGIIQPGDPNIPRWINDWLGDIAKAQGNIDKYNKALTILEKAADAACKCWYKPWTWF